MVRYVCNPKTGHVIQADGSTARSLSPYWKKKMEKLPKSKSKNKLKPCLSPKRRKSPKKARRKSVKCGDSKGWGNLSPKGHARKMMEEECGSPCFLDPLNKGFPVCRAGTCSHDVKGLASACKSARRLASPKTKKVKGKSKKFYEKIAQRAVDLRKAQMRGKQGYYDREDESLGMRLGSQTADKESLKDRRDESYGDWGKRDHDWSGSDREEPHFVGGNGAPPRPSGYGDAGRNPRIAQLVEKNRRKEKKRMEKRKSLQTCLHGCKERHETCGERPECREQYNDCQGACHIEVDHDIRLVEKGQSDIARGVIRQYLPDYEKRVRRAQKKQMKKQMEESKERHDRDVSGQRNVPHPLFEGEWKNDKPYEGKGKWKYSDGEYDGEFEGEWRDGKPYDGEWYGKFHHGVWTDGVYEPVASAW